MRSQAAAKALRQAAVVPPTATLPTGAGSDDFYLGQTLNVPL